MIKHIIKLIWNKKKSNALMILEIFLSFLVLFFVLSYFFFNMELVNKPLGFETKDRWMINLDNIDQKDSLDIVLTMNNLKANLLAEDNILDATFIKSIAPFTNNGWIDGNDENGFEISSLVVPCDYKMAEVMNMNILEGRWFTEEDLSAAIEPLVVNKNFIEKYYPKSSMIDSLIYFGGQRKIIGVVDEFRYPGEFEEPHEITFKLYPFIENYDNVILKMKPNITASFEERLSNIVNTTTKTTGSVILNLEKRRIVNGRNSWVLIIALLSICGFLCLNVALGLFGVLWYNINKRKSEIGLRQALGAHSLDIMKQFIIEILIITLFAIIIGIFFAIQIPLLKVTEYPDILFYKSILYTTLIILILVSVCALFPSIQAARITPATSLHED
jgi:putative ABC transport system permease protein